MKTRGIRPLSCSAAFGFMLLFSCAAAFSDEKGSAQPIRGCASWYGEELRGKLMANGQPFDPDQLTAACWFYPLGTKIRVSLDDPKRRGELVVTVTDRGPSRELVARGRVIDLSHAAFQALGRPATGLIPVKVSALNGPQKDEMGLTWRPISRRSAVPHRG
jgi:rare lipoprotein A